MEGGLIRVTPNKERAKAILKMAEDTMEMVKGIDRAKFPSHVLKEYYEIIRELMSALLILDGYKMAGEGAHKQLIEYISRNYRQFTARELYLLDDMRDKRNRISYDGFFITEDYLRMHEATIFSIIEKLKKILVSKI